MEKIKDLPYLEIPIVKHCNLNCKYCSHMANVEDEYFMSIEVFVKDLMQMKTMFEKIPVIRLLGGEPLLHPQLTKLISWARKIYPESEIKIATNGLKITTLDEETLKCLRDNHIIVDITMYKPTERRAYEISQTLLNNKIDFYLSPLVVNFQRRMLKEPISDPEVSWSSCRARYCVVLLEGTLSACYAPRLIPIAKKKYNKTFDAEGSVIDIYENCTKERIIDFLNSPNACCAYCGVPEAVEWERSEKYPDISEWYVDIPMK